MLTGTVSTSFGTSEVETWASCKKDRNQAFPIERSFGKVAHVLVHAGISSATSRAVMSGPGISGTLHVNCHRLSCFAEELPDEALAPGQVRQATRVQPFANPHLRHLEDTQNGPPSRSRWWIRGGTDTAERRSSRRAYQYEFYQTPKEDA